MAYPYNLQTKTLTGQFADLYEDKVTGEILARHREGYVYITPYHNQIKVIDQDITVDLYELQRQRVKMENGTFTAEVLVTDQPNISPGGGWTYKIEFSWRDCEEFILPITADLPSVIDINDYQTFPEDPGVIIATGPQGRSIVNVTASGPVATVTYSDGTTSTFPLPLPEGGGNYQYVHTQNSAAKDWVINHNLNKWVTAVYVTYASTLTDPTADQILANWTNVDQNTIIVHHGGMCSGKAVI